MQLSTHVIRGAAGLAGLPTSWDSARTLVLVFGARTLGESAEVLPALSHAFPASLLFGCSTAGEIQAGQLHDDTLSVAVLRFGATDLGAAAAGLDAGAEQAARDVARALCRPGLRALFVLTDGLHANASDVVRGLRSVVPPDVMVIGGLAADGNRFERTWVVRDRRALPRGLAALAFYGDRCRVGHGTRSGWDCFGPERRVTRSRGNVVLELDGRPPLELYSRYLGRRAEELPAAAHLFPLSLRAGAPPADRVLRSAVSVNEADGSMAFAGDVPEGAYVQLGRANADRLVQSASQAGYQGQGAQEGRGPALAVTISSVGRRLVLGERAEEEIEATLGALPPDSEQVGFYAYGGIAPSVGRGPCDLHNEAMTLVTIGEAAA